MNHQHHRSSDRMSSGNVLDLSQPTRSQTTAMARTWRGSLSCQESGRGRQIALLVSAASIVDTKLSMIDRKARLDATSFALMGYVRMGPIAVRSSIECRGRLSKNFHLPFEYIGHSQYDIDADKFPAI